MKPCQIDPTNLCGVMKPDTDDAEPYSSGYWYCRGCCAEVDSRAVTFQERHVLCGWPVDWIAENEENN